MRTGRVHRSGWILFLSVALVAGDGEDCVCDDVFEPVCGVDGVTYTNACEAECSGADIDHEGTCEPVCPLLDCATEAPCPSGRVIDDKGCPTCECISEGCACNDVFEPVCGVDGVTYTNACEAKCSGADIDHEGTCEPVCPLLDCATEASCPSGRVIDDAGCPTCECSDVPCESDADCPDDSLCSLEVCTNTCLSTDPGCLAACVGVCVPELCVCPQTYDPVCGVDGVTYENACEARCAAVAIESEGECGICGALGLSSNLCPAVRCSNEPDPVCGVDGETYNNACLACCDAGIEVQHRGQCLERCICPEEYRPVCGLDGFTYANACMAGCGRTEIAYEGPCTDECEIPVCDVTCAYGFQRGSDGCAICECLVSA